MTYLREANDVVRLTTPRQSPRKKQKFSGGFHGVSALESEVSEPGEVVSVSDEIRRWSNLSQGECQRFVSAEDFFNSPDSPEHSDQDSNAGG